MGNLLFEISHEDNNIGWTDAEWNTWRRIIADIWRFIAQYKSTHMHLSSLYRSLVASLIDKYCIGAVPPCPFFQEGPLLSSLTVLINFTIFKSGRFVPLNGPLGRPRRSRRAKVPRVFESTASEEAIRQATQWTENVFEEMLVE
jgi:hypothetical protein